MGSLAFPLRLKENGLLDRGSQAAAVIALLQLMARTPQGSWAGCPRFGLRDLFENSRLRADAARLAMERINESFRDLEMDGFVVTEVAREISPGRETDTYSISIEVVGGQEPLQTRVAYEP